MSAIGRRRSISFLPPVTLGVLALTFLLGCASWGVEQAAGPPAQRPDDCELVEVGPFRIARSVQDRRSLREMARIRGYDRITGVREIIRTWTDRYGTAHERVVGWEGIGWRWNNPNCRIGRGGENPRRRGSE